MGFFGNDGDAQGVFGEKAYSPGVMTAHAIINAELARGMVAEARNVQDSIEELFISSPVDVQVVLSTDEDDDDNTPALLFTVIVHFEGRSIRGGCRTHACSSHRRMKRAITTITNNLVAEITNGE